jgi:hypothetical protein
VHEEGGVVRQAGGTAELRNLEDTPKHSADQSNNLKAKADEYGKRAKRFRFLRDHLVKGARYRLENKDLHFLGVIDQRYY